MRKILFPVWMMQLITLYFACKRRLSQKVKLKDIQILKTFVECFQLTNDKQEYKHNFDFPKILRIFKRWIQQNYRNKNFTNSQEYFVKFYQNEKMNDDYEEFLNDDSPGSAVYNMTIRLESVDTGSFYTKPTTKIIAYVGSRKFFHLNPITFVKGEGCKNTWQFKYRNPNKSTFIICLAKRHMYFDEVEIGRIEVRLKDIPANQVVTQEFQLKPPAYQAEPPRVRLQLNRNEAI